MPNSVINACFFQVLSVRSLQCLSGSKPSRARRWCSSCSPYRNAEGQPRQRVVASLGDAKLPEGEERQIAQAVERRLQGNRDWFDDVSLSENAAAWVARVVQIAGRSKAASPVGSDTLDHTFRTLRAKSHA